MTGLQIAVLAFAAGFFTCVVLVLAIVGWSFSEKRVRDVSPASAKRHQQRTV